MLVAVVSFPQIVPIASKLHDRQPLRSIPITGTSSLLWVGLTSWWCYPVWKIHTERIIGLMVIPPCFSFWHQQDLTSWTVTPVYSSCRLYPGSQMADSVYCRQIYQESRVTSPFWLRVTNIEASTSGLSLFSFCTHTCFHSCEVLYSNAQHQSVTRPAPLSGLHPLSDQSDAEGRFLHRYRPLAGHTHRFCKSLAGHSYFSSCSLSALVGGWTLSKKHFINFISTLLWIIAAGQTNFKFQTFAKP